MRLYARRCEYMLVGSYRRTTHESTQKYFRTRGGDGSVFGRSISSSSSFLRYRVSRMHAQYTSAYAYNVASHRRCRRRRLHMHMSTVPCLVVPSSSSSLDSLNSWVHVLHCLCVYWVIADCVHEPGAKHWNKLNRRSPLSIYNLSIASGFPIEFVFFVVGWVAKYRANYIISIRSNFECQKVWNGCISYELSTVLRCSQIQDRSYAFDNENKINGNKTKNKRLGSSQHRIVASLFFLFLFILEFCFFLCLFVHSFSLCVCVCVTMWWCEPSHNRLQDHYLNNLFICSLIACP